MQGGGEAATLYGQAVYFDEGLTKVDQKGGVHLITPLGWQKSGFFVVVRKLN